MVIKDIRVCDKYADDISIHMDNEADIRYITLEIKSSTGFMRFTEITNYGHFDDLIVSSWNEYNNMAILVEENGEKYTFISAGSVYMAIGMILSANTVRIIEGEMFKIFDSYKH